MLRLLLLAAVLLLRIAIRQGDSISFYAIVGITFALTIPYSLWVRQRVSSARSAPLLYAADIIAVTGLVYFTGGIHSDMALLYPAIVLSAGIVGSPRQTVGVLLGCTAAYFLLIGVLVTGILPPRDSFAYAANLPLVMRIFGMRVAVFTVAAGISTFLADRSRRLGEQQERLEQANRERGALTAAAELAHESRTPLSVISGAVQMLARKQKVDEAVRSDLLSLAQRETQHVDELIEKFVGCVEYREETLQKLLSRDDDRPTAEWTPPAM